jgi:predicted dehydrogenase
VIRLGFLGVGWIGRNRMEAMLASGMAEAAAVCDPSDEMVSKALASAPSARRFASFDRMLALKLDGIVIATPSALHAEQAIAALYSGAAVFCQKPLGRNAAEVEAVLAAAKATDRPLGVDQSYRHTAAMQAIRERVRSGDLGEIFAADLVFHNAFGPGNAWFWDPALSGGGCLIDLGIHLVDLALWLFDFPDVASAQASLFRGGRRKQPGEVEDFAAATVTLANGTLVRIACSWNLPAGSDAVIRASFYGTSAGAELTNEDGSFFDFRADLLRGRERERLASPPDEWGGRAAVDWLRRLSDGQGFEGTTPGLLDSARLLDSLYEAAG